MQKDGLFQKIIQIMVQMDFQLYISTVLHLWKMFCIIFITDYFNSNNTVVKEDIPEMIL